MTATVYQRITAAVIALTAVILLAAGSTPPHVLAENVTNEVLGILRQDKDIRQGNSERARQLIETRIAPHFDFERATALAVGQSWGGASAEQRERLTREFRNLLVNTYANALTAYKDQTVGFPPAKESGSDKEVTVRSRINSPGQRPISLDYALARNAAGDWKVFDVVIADVSLVTNYRSSFASEASTGGIEGLIKSLQAKNRANKPSA